MTTIDAAIRRLGGLTWISGELFALEGRWAGEVDDPAAAVHLATHSRHHGWHRTLWVDALPDSPALDATSHIGPPTPGWEAAVACLAEPLVDEEADSVDGAAEAGGALSDAHRLAALYRGLVPRLADLLAMFAAELDGPGDGEMARIVGLATHDVTADLRGGHALLAAALDDLEAIRAAAVTTKMLDQSFRTW